MVGPTGPGALDERPSLRRVALAAVPWVLAAVLGLLGVASARSTPAAPTPTGTPAPRSDAVATAGGTDPGTPRTTAASTAPSTPVVVAGAQLEPELELAVLLAARNAMGAAGLAGHPGPPDRWPLDARLASVHDITSEYAVATVHGLVLEQGPDGWGGPHPRSVAVLLQRTPSPAVVGDAWPVARPAAPTAMPELRPVDDPDPSVVAPLTEAGWSVEEVTAVEASDDALLRVAVHATPPGDDRPSDHVLWLLDAPGGPRLLPLAATTQDEELP